MDSTATFFASTAYNFGLQLSLKVVTFATNAWLIRALSPAILGIANVRLMLLYTTGSFLIREPFRRSCIKEEGQIPNNPNDWTRLINTLWLCPLLSIPVVTFLGIIWCFWLEVPTEDGYSAAVLAYACSLCMECLAEPLWILGQQLHFAKTKAGIEGAQLFLRQIGVALLTLCFPRLRLAAFPIAMVASSALYTGLYLWSFLSRLRSESSERLRRRSRDESPARLTMAGLSGRDLFPRLDGGLDWESVRVGRSFLSHCLLKHFLTEGERLLMTFTGLLSFADQGVYDVIHNLGSLVARIVFAPLEEAAHTFFSQNLRRGEAAGSQDPERLRTATRVLRFLLKLTMLMGLVVCVFGFTYSRLALHLYAGPVLSVGVGPRLLQLYCPYVLLLALNGISESFLFTIIGPDVMSRHKLVLVGTCVGFVGVVYGGAGLGTPVFVLANMLNMLVRITFSLRHIQGFYSAESGKVRFETESAAGSPLLALIPSARILFTLSICGAMTKLTELIFGFDGFFNITAQIAFGGVALLFSLFTIYGSEQEMVDFIETNIVKNKEKRE